jgi:predicted nucleotidyltransferase
VDRRAVLEYLRKTRFAEGDRASAEAQARSIAHYLKQEYGATRLVGIGSLFSSHKLFRPDSDIDLIAAGIPPDVFFRASARAADMTAFKLDLIPLESATPLVLERMEEEAVEL